VPLKGKGFFSMSVAIPFPSAESTLRAEVVGRTADRLWASYSQAERNSLRLPSFDRPNACSTFGDGSADWESLGRMLDVLQELVMPGTFVGSNDLPGEPLDLSTGLGQATDHLHSILKAYFILGHDEEKSGDLAALATLNLIERLPKIRERAEWNVFASLKDPAVWDSFTLQRIPDRSVLANIKFLEIIDESIRRRDRDYYVSILQENGIEGPYEYQLKLIKRAYPSWRALLMHDFAHVLACVDAFGEKGIECAMTPFFPRLIAEHTAHLFQTDLHPETAIGDANFFDHTHRGITTGQTGKIGIGCVIYPCTLGGVTDKVKQRHPLLGDFVLIGTDVGIFGPVAVGEGSVIGPNTEINGFVELGKGVKIRAAVVARTVISTNSRPGRLIFEDGVSVGEETLIINDHPTDLVIPAGTEITPNSFVVNDGSGNPKASESKWP
jgi:serine acetyltransferase